MELTLLAVPGEAIGYSRMGTNIRRHLEAQGVDVFDRIDEPSGTPKSAVSYMLEEQGERRFKRTNAVCWASVPGHARGWWNGQHASILTMYETTQLPESFRETLHNFDLVMVPSDQNVELFSRFHPNVVKVPLGIDPDVWCFRERKPPTTRFNFLIGGSGARKGTDVAYKAFRRVFPDGSWGDGPEPWLILKSPKPEDFYGARIERVPGRIDAADEVALYASAHCYLQPSRGEGFGLQPLQAIAQGCPTILTDAHGHRDFAHLGIGLSSTLAKAAYFIHGDSGEWWEPDLDELCDRMRWVYDNYAECCDHAQHASVAARERFTWANSARTFIDAIGRDVLDAPYAGSGWFEPKARMYHARVLRSSGTMEIAGLSYQLEPGVDYWVPADVKRIVWESGNLEPSCLHGLYTVDGHDSEIGITREQAEQYMNRRQWCGTCGQSLGDVHTKADELFAEMSG